ncbi:putative glycoside hydrolase family 64 protein [Phaeomoniella chlamydospora]|uniref:Putative glycoside hydrolase family 64 protein n=1 Tax=Phaeomoniella chlamydospora TaxID=158046 RepID=A0A0G2E9L9_PHACM|nr:putative glycoside hydrolase family 64 protein [Phaeomoniella chlamydospora]
MDLLRSLLFATLALAFLNVSRAVPLKTGPRGAHPYKDTAILASLSRRRIDANTWVLTSNNTFNSTTTHSASTSVASDSPSTPLSLAFTNNASITGNINAYVTGLDGDGAAFFLISNGTAYYPANPLEDTTPTSIIESVAISLSSYGETLNISLPNYITSGRIYFSVGELNFATTYGESGTTIVAPSFTNPSDPNINVSYGFVEFTWDKDAGLYSNLSYVDYVGLVIGQLVSTVSNGVCEVLGLPSDAVTKVCSLLAEQEATDGQIWSKSCQTDSSGNPLRVLAPLHLTEIESSALSGYYDDYVDQVWDYYSYNNLIITAGDNGNFTGKVNNSTGNLEFDLGGSFTKPDITDILGCNSGPFANPANYSTNSTQTVARESIVPRLCAAFNRSTLLLPGGNIQPDGVDSAQYYITSPTNHYSRIVHATETDGKGYTFAYDDVHPSDEEDVSGLCVASDPVQITFTVG